MSPTDRPSPRRADERLVLVDLVHREPCDVLGQRGLDGAWRRRLPPSASHGHRFGSSFVSGQTREVKARKRRCSGDDVETLAVLADQKRLQEAEAFDAGDQIGDILAALGADVERTRL
jgi:hypothetical protein